jgi:hypothetical protein
MEIIVKTRFEWSALHISLPSPDTISSIGEPARKLTETPRRKYNRRNFDPVRAPRTFSKLKSINADNGLTWRPAQKSRFIHYFKRSSIGVNNNFTVDRLQLQTFKFEIARRRAAPHRSGADSSAVLHCEERRSRLLRIEIFRVLKGPTCCDTLVG